MIENKSNFTKELKEQMIKKEISKLKAFFKDLGSGQAEIANRLIEEAAFLKVTLVDLKETINKMGTESFYKNGENQYGTKRSPAFENYINANKQHIQILKQLSEMLPEASEADGNELLAFIAEARK